LVYLRKIILEHGLSSLDVREKNVEVSVRNKRREIKKKIREGGEVHIEKSKELFA
jgi:hypothetical protein